MARQREDIETRRNNFYRDSYRRALKLLIFFLLTAVVLAGFLMYLDFSRAQPKYYASLSTGELMPLQALSEPVVTNRFILQWSSTVARQAYTLDFVHWKTELQGLQPYFTPNGWRAFLDAMNSGALKAIKTDKLQASAVVTGPPVIVSTEVIDGHFTWMIQLPLLVTYQSASQVQRQHLKVTIIATRVSTLTTVRGIQVKSFYAESVSQ